MIDTDGNGKLTAEELQRVLINGNWRPFNIETIRLMMNMFDRDHSGAITFDEFVGLWNYIENWKRCFQSFDTDHNGTIDANELKMALLRFGFNLSDALVNNFIVKFDRFGNGTLTFDNFIQICVTVRQLTDAFKLYDTDMDGIITISYEQFLQLVINNQ